MNKDYLDYYRRFMEKRRREHKAAMSISVSENNLKKIENRTSLKYPEIRMMNNSTKMDFFLHILNSFLAEKEREGMNKNAQMNNNMNSGSYEQNYYNSKYNNTNYNGDTNEYEDNAGS